MFCKQLPIFANKKVFLKSMCKKAGLGASLVSAVEKFMLAPVICHQYLAKFWQTLACHLKKSCIPQNLLY